MKKSKRAIKEVFKNDDFRMLLTDYYKGDLDPHNLEDLTMDSWGMIIYRFDMDKDGAEDMIRLRHDKEVTSINITYDEDTNFSAITVREDKGALLIWLLDLIGFENYTDMDDFDPNNYDTYSKYVTLHSDDEEEEEW